MAAAAMPRVARISFFHGSKMRFISPMVTRLAALRCANTGAGSYLADRRLMAKVEIPAQMTLWPVVAMDVGTAGGPKPRVLGNRSFLVAQCLPTFSARL